MSKAKVAWVALVLLAAVTLAVCALHAEPSCCAVVWR